MSKPHKKLVAWKKSMDLVEQIYELSKKLPRDEIYGLTSQLRRAAVQCLRILRKEPQVDLRFNLETISALP